METPTPDQTNDDPVTTLTQTTQSTTSSLDPSQPNVMFVDSSAIVALVDRDDAAHRAVVEAYRELVSDDSRFFTTNYAVAEAFDLLTVGPGPTIARQWLRDSQLAIYHADQHDLARARRKILRADDDRRLSLTDAVGLAVMERLGVTDAFAVDPNFLAETS